MVDLNSPNWLVRRLASDLRDKHARCHRCLDHARMARGSHTVSARPANALGRLRAFHVSPGPFSTNLELENLENLEPLENLESLESLEPLENLEPLEPLENLEPLESLESLESLEPLEPLEGEKMPKRQK